jgi:hypothetical protein
LGAAKDIDSVFKQHPDLDPGHRRLKIGTRLENVDHINWEMWKGDLVSGRCDLPSAWQTGHDMALAILIQSQLNPISFSFVSLFADPAIDMLCPFGMNKYLGISEDDPEDVSLKNPPTPPRILQPHPTLPDTKILHVDSNDEADEPMLTFEEALAAQANFDLPHSVTQSITAQSAQSDPSAPPIPEGPGIRPEDYLLFKGRWIHKQTICHLVIVISHTLDLFSHPYCHHLFTIQYGLMYGSNPMYVSGLIRSGPI